MIPAMFALLTITAIASIASRFVKTERSKHICGLIFVTSLWVMGIVQVLALSRSTEPVPFRYWLFASFLASIPIFGAMMFLYEQRKLKRQLENYEKNFRSKKRS